MKVSSVGVIKKHYEKFFKKSRVNIEKSTIQHTKLYRKFQIRIEIFKLNFTWLWNYFRNIEKKSDKSWIRIYILKKLPMASKIWVDSKDTYFNEILEKCRKSCKNL